MEKKRNFGFINMFIIIIVIVINVINVIKGIINIIILFFIRHLHLHLHRRHMSSSSPTCKCKRTYSRVAWRVCVYPAIYTQETYYRSNQRWIDGKFLIFFYRAAPLAYCTQRSYCHWWEREADHLPVPAEFQFELLNKLSSSVVLHNFILDLPGCLNLQCLFLIRR